VVPYKLVLVAWMLLSALLLLDRNRARGFSIAVVGGLMLLPSGQGITIVGLPDLDKGNVASLGLLLGTLAFHPARIFQFRPRASDALLLALVCLAVVTAMSNGYRLYDGLSLARGQLFAFVLPIFLARIHLDSPKALLTFLAALVVAAVAYLPLEVWEFRMSPQLHRQTYGFHPHSFITFVRGSLFRPVVYFNQPLTLGRFNAFLAFLALLPLRPYLTRRFPYGQYYFLAPLLALLLSRSWGPYMMFALLCGLYYVARRALWVPYLVPAAAGVWLILVFAGVQPLYGVVDSIAKLNPQRADSLRYRLDALDEYRVAILEKPGVGWGGWGNARTRRATDSAFLINGLSRGLTGALMLYGWWFWVMHMSFRLARRIRGTPLGKTFLSIGLLIAVAMAICAIDDALDYHILYLAGSVMALERVLRGVSPARGVRAPRPAPQREMPVYVYR
jgi:hypothetical protein